jgi:Ca2+-binding RTX toxin-like protein
VLILGFSAYAASGPVRELFGGGRLGPGAAGSEEVFEGTPGRDRIERGGGDDIIRALAGNDTVFDIGGRNVAYGGDGNDWMIVTGSLYGGPGQDQLEPFGGPKPAAGRARTSYTPTTTSATPSLAARATTPSTSTGS